MTASEIDSLQWLHGRHVPVRNYRYVFKPRPFEEMSDPGNSSIGIRDDSHSGKNGYDDENGYATKDGDDDENGQDGVKAYDNENGYDGEDEDNSVIRTGDANVNEHADENDHASENGYVGENGTQGMRPLFATNDAQSSHICTVIILRVLTPN